MGASLAQRVLADLDTAGAMDELMVLLRARYFRAFGRHMNYGLSARGLTIGTASAHGKELPHIAECYLERLRDPNSLAILALPNSQSVISRHRADLHKRDEHMNSVEDVTARVDLVLDSSAPFCPTEMILRPQLPP